ncbi:hypothetical protein, partial [Neisseria meningitidis]
MFNVTEPARLQSAANAAAPYASEAIGRTFGHGENKNETARDLCKIPFPPDSRNPNTGFRLFSF